MLLGVKLKERFSESNKEIQEVISRLAEEGYLSDVRYAELFIRQQIGKKRGRQRILLEARQRGVQQQAKEILDSLEIDWMQLALENLEMKYFGKVELKEKVFRYLSGQGFEIDDVFKAYDCYLQKSDQKV